MFVLVLIQKLYIVPIGYFENYKMFFYKIISKTFTFNFV